MLIKNKENWSLLAKYLADEAGDAEKEAVQKWLDKSAVNRALFEKLRADWKVMESMKKFDVDNAWEKLHSRIIAGEDVSQPVVIQSRRILVWSTPMRIAASLLFVAMLAVAAFVISGKATQMTVVTAGNNHKVLVLPDGSKITLNGDSKVQYAKRFVKNTRDIELTGEAFFEVAPDKQHPFIIHTGHASIKVVGTSFNVESNGVLHEVKVYVSTGIVQLYQSGNEKNSIMLHPGDIGSMRDNMVRSTRAINQNAIAWKTGRMDFRDVPWAEAIKMLNKVYGVNIVYREPELGVTPLTGEYLYPQESLDTILSVLCKQNHLNIEKSGDKIYLSK